MYCFGREKVGGDNFPQVIATVKLTGELLELF